MAVSRESRAAWPNRSVRLPLLIGLGVVAIGAWVVTAWQATSTDALMMAGVPMDLTTGGRLGVMSLVLFLAIWLAMMAAMMFPSVWPTVLLYATVTRKQGQGSVPLFLAGYLLAWEGFGLLAYAGYVAIGAAFSSRPGAIERLPLFTAGAILLAAVYQFTPLKRFCLTQCQNPLTYLMFHWRSGAIGALRMGLSHGKYCLGCCWGLMLTLIALGVMDLRWMATVAVVIALEKLGPRHAMMPRLVGAALVILAVAVAVWPRGSAPM